ncbi:SDR family oxidoreductase [Aquicoccus porphyridii]|uniref:SDR family oxidoreductase n=1 Tax=Aquicoccus porphyridii TaxID=1852029 RepID=A0A5A9YY56_9RHOB|nr:SDR family oxidoreductase [Aquicoccus porphyridii]KAA0909816.1 SDR family oxidoreductase [Aquicoccus porphyridii]RAI51905.1 short-chain dehydrogenase [Rhodobacteraceae bacterium AsT-22]
MFDLKGKVVVVTGSSRGIGRAIAEVFARQGARVVVSSRTAEACTPVAEAIRNAGGDALVVPCHIGKKQDLRQLVDKTIETWGRIDVLVCNAAINPVYGPMSDLTDEAFDKIMGTNVRSTWQLCEMVLPGMAANGGGAVVILSSIAGLRGNAVIGAYGMSKAAEAALARNLAVEWGPKNIRVNALAPGLVKTDFARALWEDPERLARAENQTPLRRIGTPEDIAGVALFLATDASAYVTGQTIVADGGEVIR